MSAVVETLAALRRPEDLYDLLDPDVMWYSADVDSNCTCNDKDDVIACIERNLAAGSTGRFDVLREHDDVVVVRPVREPPREGDLCLLLRFRDGLIVEMRDFRSPSAADRYAGLAEAAGGET
jgi:hypothetical protein